MKALGVDVIGLYQFHRPDPKVPYAESIGGLKELLDAGKIRMAGISNASIEQIGIARGILGEGNLAQRAEPVLARVPLQRGRAAATAPSSASRSCPGARSAASAGPAGSARGTPRSRRWPTRTACPRSGSRWPGCWPWPRS